MSTAGIANFICWETNWLGGKLLKNQPYWSGWIMVSGWSINLVLVIEASILSHKMPSVMDVPELLFEMVNGMVSLQRVLGESIVVYISDISSLG